MTSLVKGECSSGRFFPLFIHLLLGVVIVGAKRTPFGTYGGKLTKTSITDLQTVAAKAALTAANVKPEQVDTVVIGNVLTVINFLRKKCSQLILCVL